MTKLFEEYNEIYNGFYEAVYDIAEMEDRFSRGEKPSEKGIIKYQNLCNEVLAQCSEGTDIEDLIGLVVVGEERREKSRGEVRKEFIRRVRERSRLERSRLAEESGKNSRKKVKEEYVPQSLIELYRKIGMPL